MEQAMYQEMEAKILSVAGISAPLNDLRVICLAANLRQPTEDEVTGFNEATAGKTCDGFCPRHHEEEFVLWVDACCKAFRRGYAIGAYLHGQKPGFIVSVYKPNEMEPYLVELWINSRNGYRSKEKWDLVKDRSARFDSILPAAK